jgi:exonuclease SbcC
MLEQHEAYDRWQERLRFEKAHLLPAFTAQQLDDMEAAWNRIEAYEHTEDLKRKLAKALAQGHHECPKCAHRWPVAGEEVALLEELIRVDGVHGRRVDPKLTRVQIQRERELIADALSTAEERERLTAFTEVCAPTLSRDQIARGQLALAKADERVKLQTEAAQIEQLLKTQPDYRAMYEARLAYEAALKQYLFDSAEYEKWLAHRSEAQARAGTIEPQLGCLSALHDRLVIAAAYEQALVLYERAMVEYTSQMAAVECLKTEADGWKRAKSALNTLRTLVKQHLVPSLNRVASSLIRSMTGGQRQSIAVDEEFDVTVDGQPLNTLSGSGKAVANLSLRIGLGQVLTNNVLSLFVGDEIDSSLDKDRAENTAMTFEALKSRISQILLITHKRPCADYYIELK